MFILPYVYHTHVLPHTTIHVFSLLTVGGHALWKEEGHLRVTEEILHPNGLFPIQCTPYKDVICCELDSSKINWSDYYEWAEMDPQPNTELFCWRTFYLLGSPPVGCPSSERLSPYTYQELLTLLFSLRSA